MTASYHDRVNVLQGTKADCPFDRAEWFALLADSGLAPLIATVGSQEALAALALTEANGRIEPLRNWYSFTWRPQAPDGGAGDALLRDLARALRQRAPRITLWPVPDEDGSATRLEAALREVGWWVAREQCDHNHVLPVRGRSFAEYWAERPGRMRTTLKRKARKVEVEILTRFEGRTWAEYADIYAASWKPEEGDPGLLRRFAEDEGAAGRIRLGIARTEGKAIAAQFWTVESGIAYIHKLAHREEYKSLSAGTTLSAALFEYVINTDRVDLVDFGTGDDPYKRDWMEEDRPRYRIDALDPRQPAAWAPLAKRFLTRLAPAKRQG